MWSWWTSIASTGATDRAQLAAQTGGAPWAEHPLWGTAPQESPRIARLAQQAPPVAIFSDATQVFIASPRADSTQPWTARSLPLPGGVSPLGSHGLGLGDLDGDGRTDVVTPRGYWSQPADPDAGWPFTAVDLSPDCAQMHVFDVSGDGLADVVSSSAHAFGVWWHERQRDGGFVRRELFALFSQSHALEVADLDGDGRPDLVISNKRGLFFFEQQ